MGPGNGGSTLVHVGTNNVEREGKTARVRKFRQLVRRAKQTWAEQIILSGIIPVTGSKEIGKQGQLVQQQRKLNLWICRDG